MTGRKDLAFAACLLLLALALFIGLSAHGLAALGIPYDAPGGNPLAKIHPGSWLVCLAYFLALSSHGHPFAVAARQLRRHGLLAAYLICTVVLMAYSVARHGMANGATLFDTHFVAALSCLTLLLLQRDWHRRVLWLLALMLIVNASLGVVEAIAQQSLISLRVGGEIAVAEEYFRATALMGHPLENAMVTAVLMPVVLLLPISGGLRAAIWIWLGLSLLAFGGRTSFVLAILFYGAYFTCRAFVALVHGRMNYLKITGGAVVVVLCAAVVAATVMASGLGERIFKSLVFDNSASVRVHIWSLLDFMSDVQHLFGNSSDELEILYQRAGLDSKFVGIENFWLVMYLRFGATGFFVFALGMLCLIAYLWRSSFGAFRLAVPLMLLIASSSNSLAAKAPSTLTPFMLAITAAAHLRPRRGLTPRPVPVALRPYSHA